MTLQEREARACAIIDSMAEELCDVSLYLHDNPELGLDEHKAIKVINQFLETHNFTSQVGLTDLPELQTALRGDYNGTAQHKIAFLGEYDALPEPFVCYVPTGHGSPHQTLPLGATISFRYISNTIIVHPYTK